MALATEMTDQMKALQAALSGVNKTAHTTGEEMQSLGRSILSFGKLFSAEFLAHAAQQVFSWVKEQAVLQRRILKDKKEERDNHTVLLKQLQEELKALRAAPVLDRTRIELQKERIRDQKKELLALSQEIGWRQGIYDLVTKNKTQHAIAYGVLHTTLGVVSDTFKTAHLYNQALVQTNTALGARFGLVKATLAVQTELGASTQAMAESAEALVAYGHDLTPAYRENLKIVTMMRNGLGVAAHTSAELVTIFTRQLRQGAEQVGNVIAQVAAQTGLAAQKAAEFAIEIGRALRLLGPGFRSEAAGVTKVITTLAGRVQELGGNASAVVNMFRQMSGGNAQAFFLRGLAGGARPGQMGTERGVEQAMRGLEQRLGQMLTAPEGSEMYVAQLEAASEMTGMATADIIDFREAVKALNVPLTEAKALQKAYREQTALLGESMSQVREAIHSLTISAALPLVQALTWLARGLSSAVRTLVAWKPLVPVLQIALPVAALTAGYAVAKLGREIIKFAMESALARAMIAKGTIPNFSSWASIRGWMATGSMGVFSMVGAGLVGGALGAAVGTFIDRKFPNNTLSQVFRLLGKWYEESKASNSRSYANYSSGRYSSYEDARDTAKQIQEAVLGGASPQEVTRQLNALMNRVNAMTVGKGNPLAARDYAIEFARRMVVDQAGLSIMRRAGTVKSEDDIREDKKAMASIEMLALLKAQLSQQEKIKLMSVEQNEAMHKSFREQLQRWNNSIFSNFPPPDSLSNRNSFRVNP